MVAIEAYALLIVLQRQLEDFQNGADRRVRLGQQVARGLAAIAHALIKRVLRERMTSRLVEDELRGLNNDIRRMLPPGKRVEEAATGD